MPEPIAPPAQEAPPDNSLLGSLKRGAEASAKAKAAAKATPAAAPKSPPDGHPALEEETQEPEKPAAKQKFKLKFGEAEEEIDEDAIREWRKTHENRKELARGAGEKFETASKKEKEIQEFWDAVKADPMNLYKLAEKAGYDPTEVAAAYARQWEEKQKQTPEQRAFSEQQAKFHEQEQKLQAERQKLDQENFQREVQAFREKFIKALPPVLEKHGLPDDEITVGEIGKLVAAQVRGGMTEDYDLAAETYAEHQEQITKTYLERLARTPGALLKKFPELAKRLREEDLASVKKPPQAVRPAGKQTPPRQAPNGEKPMTYLEEERAARRARFGLPPEP